MSRNAEKQLRYAQIFFLFTITSTTDKNRQAILLGHAILSTQTKKKICLKKP